MSFIFIFIFAFPVIWEVEPILKFWLHDIPPYAVIFVRLALVATIVDSLSGMLQQTALATGKIKEYTKVVTIIMLSYIVWVYLFFKLGYPPQTMIYIEMGVYFCAFIARMLICKNLYNLNMRAFIFKVTFREFLIAFVSFCTIFAYTRYINIDLGMIGNIILYFILCVLFSWALGLSSYEKAWIKSLIYTRFRQQKG